MNRIDDLLTVGNELYSFTKRYGLNFFTINGHLFFCRAIAFSVNALVSRITGERNDDGAFMGAAAGVLYGVTRANYLPIQSFSANEVKTALLCGALTAIIEMSLEQRIHLLVKAVFAVFMFIYLEMAVLVDYFKDKFIFVLTVAMMLIVYQDLGNLNREIRHE